MDIGRDAAGWELTTTRSRIAEIVVADCATPVLSVVIVTYATGPIIVDCIAALEQTLVAIPHELIVVDNAGPGGLPTTSRLRLTTSGVRLIASGSNTGFGGGNEVGIAHARGQVLCLLNPDVIASPGWAEPLIAAVNDPTVGVAAPVLLDPDGTVQEAGQTIDRRAITRPVTTLPAIPIIDVAYSSAACWMMRRQVHDDVGGFDAAYHPAYFEDVDFAFRVHRAGLRTVLVTASTVFHHRGSSTRVKPAPALAQQAVLRRRWAPHLRQIAASA